jgi:ppGpp synthetase/RelA/SpoT-type nucleotidyltranferase
MTDLDAARVAWIAERPLFKQFGDMLADRLRIGIRKLGVPAEVTARPKEIDSLIKKLLLKPQHTYESLPDKVGVRIVFKYLSDGPRVQALVSEHFDHEPPDDKARERGDREVGYLSVHLDNTRLRADDAQIVLFPPSKFFAEVQLRTQAQHLWSEMSHDDVYKNDETVKELPGDLKRRINLMAGQVEVADREFDRINAEIEKEDAYLLLKALEKNYFKLTTRRPNPELSLRVIRLLLPRFDGQSIAEIIEHVNRTFEGKAKFLEHVYQDPDRQNDSSAFLFQPEALMIYDRLLDDRDETLRVWNEQFPSSELERVANNFGLALE